MYKKEPALPLTLFLDETKRKSARLTIIIICAKLCEI